MLTVVPSLGGTALLVGGIVVLAIDRRDLLANPTEPRPILVRYTSQATYSLKARPHWIFLLAICIFAPCLWATSQWQATLASNSIRDGLRLHGTACAFGAIGLALFPMGNVLGTIVHTITAGAMACFGLNYNFQAYFLADERGQAALATFRLVIGSIGALGALVTLATIYPAVQGTAVLKKHQRLVLKHSNDSETETAPEGWLSDRQILQARIGEAALAFGQISIALCVSLSLLSAAAEVSDVEERKAATALVGIFGAVGAFLLAVIFYVTNGYWYAKCQAKADLLDDDGGDFAAENDLEGKTDHPTGENADE